MNDSFLNGDAIEVQPGEAHPTPGRIARVSPFFIVQGRRDTEARQGFRAAGLPMGFRVGRSSAERMHWSYIVKDRLSRSFDSPSVPIPLRKLRGMVPSGLAQEDRIFKESYAALKGRSSTEKPGISPSFFLTTKRTNGKVVDRYSGGKVCVRVLVFEKIAVSYWLLASSQINPNNPP
jgi:hypothetical protein